MKCEEEEEEEDKMLSKNPLRVKVKSKKRRSKEEIKLISCSIGRVKKDGATILKKSKVKFNLRAFLILCNANIESKCKG